VLNGTAYFKLRPHADFATVRSEGGYSRRTHGALTAYSRRTHGVLYLLGGSVPLQVGMHTQRSVSINMFASWYAHATLCVYKYCCKLVCTRSALCLYILLQVGMHTQRSVSIYIYIYCASASTCSCTSTYVHT